MTYLKAYPEMYKPGGGGGVTRADAPTTCCIDGEGAADRVYSKYWTRFHRPIIMKLKNNNR